MARLMSEAEQRRRQKLQSKIGRTTSTMGLSALGVTGAAAIASKSPKTLEAIKKVPGLKKVSVKGMENTAIKSGIVSGGIGGVGGFNQASIYSAESRRRKQAVPVKKNFGLEMGHYGEEGTPLTHEEIEAEIEKAWTPSASNYDSEEKRGKRARVYQGAGLVGGGAAGTFSGVQAHKAIQESKKLKGTSQIRRLKPVAAHGGKAAAGAAVAAGAITASAKIGRKRRSEWQPYAKRDTSAFGIDHVDKAFNPAKLFAGAKKAKPPGTLTSERYGDPFAHTGAKAREAYRPQLQAIKTGPAKTKSKLVGPAGLGQAKYSGPKGGHGVPTKDPRYAR